MLAKFLLGAFLGVAALSASAQTIAPITWNVVGLDSNDVNVGPNLFPVGTRVCNNTAATLTGYQTRFVWDTSSSYISVSPEFISVPTLAPGACQDVFYQVAVQRSPAAYNQSARYHINLINGSSTVVASTPTPREIYVERLISQNRNAIDGISVNGTPVTLGGSVSVNEGQTYTIRLDAHTATQGYEQLEQFLGLSPDLFTIKSVQTTYTAAAGTDFAASTKLYADGCVWINDPTDLVDPSYRQCSSTGKYGGTTSVTYVVQIKSGAAAARPSGEVVNAVLYDFSGSSYHYNSDASTAGITFNFTTNPLPTEVDLAISKVGNLASPGNGQFTLSVTNTSAIAASGVTVVDNVPNGYNIKNPSSQPVPPRGTVTWVTTNPESLTWNIGPLAAGETLTYTFDVQTVNGQTDYVNQVCVSGAQTDPNSSNNCAKAQVPVALSDLAVSKSAVYTAPLKIGDALQFVVRLANLGPAVATGAQVSDTLPAGYAYVSHTCAGGWTSSTAGSVYTCTATSDVAVNSTPFTVLTINATVLAPADPTDLSGYMNSATVTSTSNDPVTANNTATASQPPTFLTIAKTSSADTFSSGGTTTGTYTLTVTKTGTTVDLGTITVSDALPEGVTATGISSSSGWTCTPSSFPSTAVIACTRADDLLTGTTLPAAYPDIVVDISFSGASNPAIVNRALVTAEKNGVTTSADETAKTVSWTNSTIFYDVIATSALPSGGSASCLPASVASGDSSTCTATPNLGYRFTGWTGDCASFGTATTCSLSNITANKASVAQFELITYTVDATVASGGGTATCTPSPVNHGSSSTCTAAPAPGYRFTGWTGDCASFGATATCSLTNITANQASVAQFELIPTNPAIATVSVGNGSAICVPAVVPYGGSTTCTATPGAGWTFSGWTGACAGQGLVCTLTNVIAPVASVAGFTQTLVAPAPIPTLSEWAMMLLISVMGLATLIVLQRRNS